MNFDDLFINGVSSKNSDHAIAEGVTQLYELSEKSKENNVCCQNFEKFRELYNMEFLDDKDTGLSHWKSRFKDNQIFKIIETIKPFILDGNPKFIAKPFNVESVIRCGTLNEILQYLTECTDTDYKSMRKSALHDGLVLGTSICKISYNFDRNPLGEIFFTTVPPENFSPDPDGDSVESCRYVIETVYADIDTIKHAFRNEKEKIKQLDDLKSSKFGAAPKLAWGNSQKFQKEEPDENKFFNKVQLCYCYIRDTQMVKKNDLWELKYPKGRLIITAPGNIKLYDGENPLGIVFPFEEYKPYPMPKEEKRNTFWGISEIMPIYGTAMESTKNYRRISNILYQHAYPQKRISRTSGLDPKTISNDPTQPIVADQGEYELMAPSQQLTPELIQWVNYLKMNIEDVSGQHPAAQGAEPRQAKSGVAIQALQTFAVKRDKLKAENFFEFLGRIGKKALRIAQNLYPDRKLITIFGNDPKKQFVFKQVNDPEDVNTDIRDIEFDVMVSVDTSLFSTRETKLAEALQLYQLGIYTPEIVLQKIDDPDAQKVLESLKIAQAKEAMLQSIMGEGAPNPSGANFGSAKRGTDLIQKRPME